MKFFLIYNNFFYRDFENKTRKIQKISICKRRVLYIFAYRFFSCHNTCKESKSKYQKMIG